MVRPSRTGASLDGPFLSAVIQKMAPGDVHDDPEENAVSVAVASNDDKPNDGAGLNVCRFPRFFALISLIRGRYEAAEQLV